MTVSLPAPNGAASAVAQSLDASSVGHRDDRQPTVDISVIVCVHNRPAAIQRCFESLERAASPGAEIILVDDCSTDETAEVLSSLKERSPSVRVVVVRNPTNLGVSGARNAGIVAATGRLIAFTDSDCTVHPQWLSALVQKMEDPGLAAISGTVLDDAPRTCADHAYVGTCRVARGRLQSRPLIGNNMCFRRSVLPAPAFEPTLRYGSDEDELAWRISLGGGRFGHAERAIVYHHHHLTTSGFLAMARRLGEGAARYGYKRGFYVGRDLLLLGSALVVTPLSFLGGYWWTIPAALLLLQLAAMLFNEVYFKDKGLLRAVSLLPLLLLFHLVKLAAVVLGLCRILAGKEPELTESKRRWRNDHRSNLRKSSRPRA